MDELEKNWKSDGTNTKVEKFGNGKNKGKDSYGPSTSVRPKLISVSRRAGDLAINPAGSGHYFLPGLRLLFQPQNNTSL